MPNEFTFLTRPDFDLDAAILLAEASASAYNGAADHAQWATQAGFTQCKSFDRDNIQGFWCAAGDVALLVFRGTSNPGQWLRDARFFPVSHPWGRVHVGFKAGVESVEQDLQPFDAVAASAKHVWITGHSLGGALALVTAARLKMKGISSRLYTYGQPRVGLSGFAERFALELPKKLYRFVNQSDIVARLPPGLLFTHTGIVKRIVRPGVLATEESAAVELNVLEVDEYTRQSLRIAAGTAPLESAAAIEDFQLSEPTLIENELPALTEEQFSALQAALNANAGSPVLESAITEGIFSIFSDHSITEYIRLLIEIRG